MPPAATPLLPVFAAIGGVLLLATVVTGVLQWRAGAARRAPWLVDLSLRVRSWWWIAALVGTAFGFGATGVTLLFAFVSALALRELTAPLPEALCDPALDVAAYALLALQYGLVARSDAMLATTALPLACLLLLPCVAVASRGQQALQARIGQRLWAVMLAVYGLSHVPALLLLELRGAAGRGLLLVLWLLVVTQASDVLQYVFGKLYGRRPIAPRLSPDKTVEGFAGGVLAATLAGGLLGWMTPFGIVLAYAVALGVALLGFAGGLVLSGVKRELQVKDWGSTLPGHGGVLDRVDSLCLSAPALFAFVRVACTA